MKTERSKSENKGTRVFFPVTCMLPDGPRTQAAVAQWTRRLPTEQEIHGSSPCIGKLLLICVVPNHVPSREFFVTSNFFCYGYSSIG